MSLVKRSGGHGCVYHAQKNGRLDKMEVGQWIGQGTEASAYQLLNVLYCCLGQIPENYADVHNLHPRRKRSFT